MYRLYQVLNGSRIDGCGTAWFLWALIICLVDRSWESGTRRYGDHEFWIFLQEKH